MRLRGHLTLIWATSNAFSITISQGLRRLYSKWISDSIIPVFEIPAMAWEGSEIFSFLHCRNSELHKERDNALMEVHRLNAESAIYALTHKIMHDVKAPLSTLVMMLRHVTHAAHCNLDKLEIGISKTVTEDESKGGGKIVRNRRRPNEP
jgi:hypothetical protein